MEAVIQTRTKLNKLLVETIRALMPGTSQISSERILSNICTVMKQVGIFGSIYLSASGKWPLYWIIMPVFVILTQERPRKNANCTTNQLEVAEKNALKAKITDLPTWGVLRVHIVEAKDLIAADSCSFLKSGPYTVLHLGEDKFETEKDNNMELNPKWNYWCDLKVFPEMIYDLLFEVLAENLIGSNELLGRTSFDLRTLTTNGYLDQWFDLEDVKQGSLHLNLQWYDLTNDPDDLDSVLQEVQHLGMPTLGSAVLSVFIESAKDLTDFNTDSMPDPYVICTINDQHEKSNIIMRTKSPVWEQGFSLLVQDPNFDVLKIEIFDNKTSATIGRYEFDIYELLEVKSLQMGLQHYALDNASSESKITMALSLAILKKKSETSIEELFDVEEDFNPEKQLRKYEEFNKRQPPIWLSESSLQFSDVDEMKNQNLTFVESTMANKFYNVESKIFTTNELSTAMKTIFSKRNYTPTGMTVFGTKPSRYEKLSIKDDFCNKFSVAMKFPYSNKLLSNSETPKMIQCLNEGHSTAMEESFQC